MEHENVGTVPMKVGVSSDFQYLPDYARYVLHNRFNDFVQERVRLHNEVDIPLLRFLKNMESDKILALTTSSSREMLSMLASNQVSFYIETTIHNWLSNQLPMISREQVHSHDITLVNFVRAKALRRFIPDYTADMGLYTTLLDEIDRFILILNSELFAAYMELQKQEITTINTALQKREKQLLEAQEIGRIGSFEWDFAGKTSAYTPEMFKIFEMDGPSNLTTFLNYVHPDDQQKVREAIDAALVDGNYECQYRYLRNNKEKIIHSRGKVQFENGKPARMIGTVTDETERHRIIQRLEESERLHKQAQAITHIGNWSWLVREDKVLWSDEMYRIYGLEPQHEQITFERFLSLVHPDDRDERVGQVKRSLETLKVDEYHFRIITAQGEAKVLRGRGEIMADQDNKAFLMLGTCQDITREHTLTEQLRDRERYLERLNRSLEAANQELKRSNEELESFNFVASHDLQEPLRKIQVYSNRILDNSDYELPSTVKEYLLRIDSASKRMQRLIEDFLVFSQTMDATQAEELIDLNAVVDEIRKELVMRIEEKKATLTVSALPKVRAVRFQLKQLMVNLISNSLKYMHADVPPQIVVTGRIVKGSEVHHPLVNGDLEYAIVTVSDNGIGFDPRYSSKIFELFQRLHSKDDYSGTGIGLALCKKIVQNLNGFITAESEPGKGAVFAFYIPVKKGEDQLRE